MSAKQKPTDPEALALIRLKRERAKAAMGQIVKRYGVISLDPDPGLEVLLDYLTNMVYALELLLKVMSGNWQTHRVGEMYLKIFDRPHLSPDLMTVLEQAIKNQKFIYEPANGLMNRVPELEGLWDELEAKFYEINWMEDTSVQREVIAPSGLIRYLRDNLPRFYPAETYHLKPQMSREHRVAMLQHRIRSLQRELEQVEAGTEPPEPTPREMCQRIGQEHMERLEDARSCFDANCEFRKGNFSFGTWTIGKVLPGCLER